MKIIFFETPEPEQSILRELLSGNDVSFFEEKLTEENVSLAKDAEVLSVFINSMLNQSIIDQIPNLKLITTRSTGVDHIDREYCKTKNILISSVPAYGSYTVAEFTFALIMNLSRKVYLANQHLRESGDYSFVSFRGFDLKDKTLGVIGTGKIGKNVIHIAKGLSMKVLAYDLYPDVNFSKEMDFEYKTLNEVLSNSDIVTLHAPYTKENHHLINSQNISLLKKGVYIINTARGELIDTDALFRALKNGTVAGAGLDVLEGERELKEEMEILSSLEKSSQVKDYKTLVEDHALIDMPNVIVTPHMAFYSKEAEEEIMKTTAENIIGFMKGVPTNIVK
ncbi:MAG: hydroxyacid dehydrogenase [bacterium]|nr:hydroxyacid dehydrogenase [bacterium]